MKIRTIVFVVATAALGTWSCSSSDFTPVQPGTGCEVGGITVSPASATLHIGDTLQASAVSSTCSGGQPQVFGPFRWKSTNSTIATVDSLSGLVRAKGTGTTTIIAASSVSPSVEGAMALNVTP